MNVLVCQSLGSSWLNKDCNGSNEVLHLVLACIRPYSLRPSCLAFYINGAMFFFRFAVLSDSNYSAYTPQTLRVRFSVFAIESQQAPNFHCDPHVSLPIHRLSSIPLVSPSVVGAPSTSNRAIAEYIRPVAREPLGRGLPCAPRRLVSTGWEYRPIAF